MDKKVSSRWRPGDLADVQTIGRVEVVRVIEGEVEVRTASGDTCWVRWPVLRRLPGPARPGVHP